MTVSPHVSGAREGHSPGAAAPGVPDAPSPGYVWRYQQPPGRRSRGLQVAVAAAIILAIAALVVVIIGLVRPTLAETPSSAATPAPARPTPPQNTADADRALCTAVGPLLAENDRLSNTFIDLGPPGSPQQDAAKPKFVSDIQDWARRIQPVVDSHPAADPFFKRSLQRLIDDYRLLVADLAAGPYQPYDGTVYSDSVAAYSGPLSICYNLGVQW
jgi:hypothetical protein